MDGPIHEPTTIREPLANHEYARRFPQLRYRPFGRLGACSVGLGACREQGEDDPRAVVAAIAGGCNVLDTAPHYHRGAHERCVGEAVRLAVAEGLCERDWLLVNTSVGRVPELVESNIRTHGFARLKALVEERFVSRGIFDWHDLGHGVHTIAPGYIHHRIEQSLAQTGLDRFDCVFLETPGLQRTCVSRVELERRIIAALEALEELCDRGAAQCYGISTADPLDLVEVMALARTAGPAARLRALRVPFSLLRQDAQPLVDAAASLGLHVFATGCLDGGTPQYQLPDELEARIGHLPDAAAALWWAQSAPGVGTALFGSRDRRHIRSNLEAAALPPLDPGLFHPHQGSSP